jgi:hypothetical protein
MISILNLSLLVNKNIIACDAIIMDMTLDFITTTRQDKKIIYYRKNNSISKELELFCKPIIELVKNNESVIFVLLMFDDG